MVTVAGNLDTREWVKYHRYSPLNGSLNPAGQSALASNIRQLHLLGKRDQVIPPGLVKDWIAKQSRAIVWQFETYTHTCCWRQQWRKVLDWVETGVSPVFPHSTKSAANSVQRADILASVPLVDRSILFAD